MTDHRTIRRTALVAGVVFAQVFAIALIVSLLFMLATGSELTGDYVRAPAVIALVMALGETYVVLRPRSWLARRQHRPTAERSRRQAAKR